MQNTTEQIRELNDAFRRGNKPYLGKYMRTRSIAEMPEIDRIAICQKVRAFQDFHEDNDPHGEHDFGAFDYKNTKYFWKIDYYAPDMMHGSEHPENIDETVRVLTIMEASEY